MTTIEVSFEYWNKLAEQTILISSLLAGFSIAVIANLLVSELNTRLSRNIMRTATAAASLFLMALFAMTNMLLKTTPGYPFKVVQNDFDFARVGGTVAFFFGIVALLAVISLAGWTKSKKMGRFTTAAGILTLILIMAVMG